VGNKSALLANRPVSVALVVDHQDDPANNLLDAVKLLPDVQACIKFFWYKHQGLEKCDVNVVPIERKPNTFNPLDTKQADEEEYAEQVLLSQKCDVDQPEAIFSCAQAVSPIGKWMFRVSCFRY
jgi:hypothetical protein